MGCCENTSTGLSPSAYPFRIDVGTTFSATVFWALQETPSVAPVAVDLTDYTAAMTVGYGGCCTSTLFTLTTENGGIAINGDLGRITLTAIAAATATYAPGPYLYRLDLTAPSGVVTRLLEGIITVSPATPDL